MMSIWMASGLAMASQALRMMPLAPGVPRVQTVPVAEPNPIRP